MLEEEIIETSEDRKITKEEYNLKLSELVEADQKSWKKEIKIIIKLVRSKEPNDMIEGQALGLSHRMKLLEDNQKYLSMLLKEQKNYKKLKAQRISVHLTGHKLDGTKVSAKELRNPLIANQKISTQQRELVISGELSDFEEAINILENAIDFNNEVIKTIDSYMFMIKNRLELFNIFK